MYVGDERGIIDFAITEQRVYDAAAFFDERPHTVAWMFTVPTRLGIRWESFQPHVRAGVIARGLTPVRNCVTVTRRALASAGVEVPRTVITVQDLFDWLRGQGYELTDLDKRPYEPDRR